eukprot:8251859-Pyramimonas_sp.AAC.1
MVLQTRAGAKNNRTQIVPHTVFLAARGTEQKPAVDVDLDVDLDRNMTCAEVRAGLSERRWTPQEAQEGERKSR